MKRYGLTLAIAGAFTITAWLGEAQAQRVTDTVVGSCVYGYGAMNCVRQFRYGDAGNSGIKVVKEQSEELAAEARERERLWVARCRPQVRQDDFGVSRYVYAAPGCEFGQFGD